MKIERGKEKGGGKKRGGGGGGRRPHKNALARGKNSALI